MREALTGTPLTRTAVPVEHGRAGFREAVASEWAKIRSTRATLLTPIVAAVLIIGMSAFVAATGSLQPDDTVLGGSLTGGVVGMIAIGCFGVLAISPEYGSGAIRITFAANPRRTTVLGAKALVVAVTSFVVAFVASTAAYQVGSVMLPDGRYARGEPMPALLGVAVCCAAIGVLGLAVGTVLRHSAGAVTAVLGVLLVPALFGPLFGDLQRWVAGASPSTVFQKLAQSSDATPEVAGSLSAGPSLALVCAYSAFALVAAAYRLNRRDV